MLRCTDQALEDWIEFVELPEGLTATGQRYLDFNFLVESSWVFTTKPTTVVHFLQRGRCNQEGVWELRDLRLHGHPGLQLLAGPRGERLGLEEGFWVDGLLPGGVCGVFVC